MKQTIRKRIKHPYLLKVGSRVKNARKSKYVGQHTLAEWTGLEQSTISKIETGDFDSKILTLKKIADALMVSVKDFL